MNTSKKLHEQYGTVNSGPKFAVGDGNTLRRSYNNMEDDKAKQVFSIFYTDASIIFAHEEIEEKINENSSKVYLKFYAKDKDWGLIKEMFVTHRIRNVYSIKDREWHVSEEIAFHVATTSLSAREYAHGIRVQLGHRE